MRMIFRVVLIFVFPGNIEPSNLIFTSAVAAHIKANDIEKDTIESAGIIYDNHRSKFTLHRALLILSKKNL